MQALQRWSGMVFSLCRLLLLLLLHDMVRRWWCLKYTNRESILVSFLPRQMLALWILQSKKLFPLWWKIALIPGSTKMRCRLCYEPSPHIEMPSVHQERFINENNLMYLRAPNIRRSPTNSDDRALSTITGPWKKGEKGKRDIVTSLGWRQSFSAFLISFRIWRRNRQHKHTYGW